MRLLASRDTPKQKAELQSEQLLFNKLIKQCVWALAKW